MFGGKSTIMKEVRSMAKLEKKISMAGDRGWSHKEGETVLVEGR